MPECLAAGVCGDGVGIRGAGIALGVICASSAGVIRCGSSVARIGCSSGSDVGTSSLVAGDGTGVVRAGVVACTGVLCVCGETWEMLVGVLYCDINIGDTGSSVVYATMVDIFLLLEPWLSLEEGVPFRDVVGVGERY